MNDNQLYIMVGPAFSGKTYWVENEFDKAFPGVNRLAVVDPDKVRRSLTGRYTVISNTSAEDIVWSHVCLMVRSLLANNNNVLLDTCNLKRYQRAKWREYDPVYVVMETPLSVSLDRAKDIDRIGLERIIRRGYDQFEPIQLNEGAMFQVRYEENEL